MKYDSIRITGHQRAGTHYIAAIICKNFLNTDNYREYYLNHKLPDVVKRNNIAYIFTWRNFHDTAKSVFNMRDRFGLQVDDFSTFLKTKYNKMWRNMPFDGIKIRWPDGDVKVNYNVSGYFKKIKHTPKEWWIRYHKQWAKVERQKPNVIRVDYDMLVNNFQSTMLGIATKLGSDKKEFMNITEKIGWNV